MAKKRTVKKSDSVAEKKPTKKPRRVRVELRISATAPPSVTKSEARSRILGAIQSVRFDLVDDDRHPIYGYFKDLGVEFI